MFSLPVYDSRSASASLVRSMSAISIKEKEAVVSQSSASKIGFFEELSPGSQLECQCISHTRCVRFSPRGDLVERVVRIVGHSLRRSSCMVGDMYELPGEECYAFFRALQQAQGEEPSSKELIQPERSSFKTFLYGLQKEHWLSEEDVRRWERDIKTTPSVEVYKKEACANRDASLAIAIAFYYKERTASNSGNRNALIWLVKSAEYALQRDLFAIQEIRSFINSIERIDYEYFFLSKEAESLCKLVAKSMAIQTIDFIFGARYTVELTQAIGALLKENMTVMKLDFSLYNFQYRRERLNAKTIVPIAEALRVNQSVEELLLEDTHMGDEGVILLLDAIDKNKESKISFLNFFRCGMGESAARRLIQFMKDHPQVTVNTGYNSGISKELQNQIDLLDKSRGRKQKQEERKAV